MVKTDSEVLREISDRLSNIEGKLCGEEGFIAVTVRRLNDHTTRIKWLERLAWGIIAVILALGIAVRNISATHAAAEAIQSHQTEKAK